ncbi:MAG: methyltransferase domain-containing protein [Verrucomicrobia bacterium]|nr:methyltransferase domain-containing protein [Verrucomicrobiota bacterium]
MKVEYVSIPSRSARAEYIARRFRDYLTGSILDVGCDRAALRQLVPNVQYTGIDIGGAPDLVIDLEATERLPFDNEGFDCVVCSDVLEHLDHLHRNFAELVRVSKRHVIISLPNNWTNARRPIERGRGSIGHYGLPAEPPADRHKWFFSLGEPRLFVEAQAQKLSLSVVELFAVEKPRFVLVRAFRRLRYARQMDYLNRYAHSLWTVLRKG